MRLPAVPSLLLILTGLLAPPLCAHQSGPSLPGVQSLDITRSGDRVHLLLGEIASSGAAPVLSHLTSDDNGTTWTKPVRVDADNTPAAGLRRGADAQLAAAGQHVIAVWQIAGTDSWGGGPMTTALSSDGGRTWKRGPNPADDGSTEGHNFIDIAADGKGVFHLVWLDNRQGKRGLRSATSADHGATWSANRTVDEETCECCWNTLAAAPDGGASVIYRDKSPRDMTLAHLGNQASKSVPVGNFQWEFPGCPHVGAGLTLAPDNSLHAAVWSGKEGISGIYYLRSTNAGAAWSEPHKLGGETSRNPDCAASQDNTIAVVWNSLSEHASPVHVAFSMDGGTHWTQPRPASKPAANAQQPRVVSTPGGFLAVWTEIADKQVVWRSTSLSIPQ